MSNQNREDEIDEKGKKMTDHNKNTQDDSDEWQEKHKRIEQP